jgi:DMSO/TMAO reductase YedYZ molybdopterin-dependent catalytic subunit
MIIRALRATLLLAVIGSAIAFGQSSPAPPANQILLTVEGEVATPLKLTAADLAKLTHRSLTAKIHDGKQATF